VTNPLVPDSPEVQEASRHLLEVRTAAAESAAEHEAKIAAAELVLANALRNMTSEGH
jgi:hypothetical protein